MPNFEIRKDAFYLDGSPFRILSGAMHYFRIHPEYWRDRMAKMRLMGLNTLETYVAWNLHEPKPVTFSFTGWNDLAAYIRLAGDTGLKVIVRPGPYICSEWEFGGLPAWLLEDPAMKLRCSHPPYIEAVDRFFGELIPRLTDLQVTSGGTNFGFMSGANMGTDYQPTVTSYDYDSPLNEQGDITPKHLAFRDVIAKYADLPDIQDEALLQKSATIAPATVSMTESVPLFDSLDILSHPMSRPTPEPMEILCQDYGLILYRTSVTGPREEAELTIRELHDRAHVFSGDDLLGILERTDPAGELRFPVPQEGMRLSILVENMGRINYGSELADRKGITDCVMLGRQMLYDWTIYPLPLKDLSLLEFRESDAGDRTDQPQATSSPGIPQPSMPAFYRGSVHVDSPADTFLLSNGWTKGIVWINGFNLGRYWNRGPQRTLYIPGPLLEKGENEIIMLELDTPHPERVVEFRVEPMLG